MSAVGGSISEVSLAGQVFPVAADAESQRKLGGFENAVESNGNGSGRMIKTRVPFSITGLTLEIDDSRDDQKFLQDLSARTEFFPISVTYASGITFSGLGIVTGEVQVSSQSQTASVDLMGPDRLTKQ